MTKKVCSVEGCEKLVSSKGFCGMHYNRFKRHGDPLGGRAFNGKHLEFINKIVSDPPEGCVYWPFSSRNPVGYAVTRHGGKTNHAHILVAERFLGDPPEEGLEVRHKCGRGHLGCVGPRCLEYGTHKQNMEDMSNHGTANRGEDNNFSKLTEDQVRAIREEQGSQREIGERYGVSHRTIGRIKNRTDWAWLT